MPAPVSMTQPGRPCTPVDIMKDSGGYLQAIHDIIAGITIAIGAIVIGDGADTAEGSINDPAVLAGAVGTVSAKLRLLTTQMAALLAELQLKADLTETQPSSIADGQDVALGALADAMVAAGATGSMSAKLRRLTTDLDAVLTAIGALALPTEAQLVTPIGTLVAYSATGAGALALSTTEAMRFRLVMVTLQLSALPTTSELLSITLNKIAGAAYDTVLDTIDPSVGPGPGLNNISFFPSGEVICLANDQIDVAYTNTDGATFGAQIIIERI